MSAQLAMLIADYGPTNLSMQKVLTILPDKKVPNDLQAIRLLQ